VSGPAYHARTHLPGGTDPIPGLGATTPTDDSYVDQILGHANLLHYWRMGAASGVQPDTSGHVGGPFDLTLQTSGTAGTYDVVGALENGEDDGAWQQNAGGTSASDHFFSVTGHRATFTGTVAFTIECWVWPDPAWTGSNAGGLVSMRQSGNGWGLSVIPAGYRLILLRQNTGNYTSVGLTAGTWQHVAATYDGTTSRIYINGELVFSETNAASIASITQPIAVGRRVSTPEEYWWGKIDEVALYDTNLSGVEIMAHATAGLPLGFGNTVKYVNAAYTMVATDSIILADGAWGPFTVTLPSADGIPGQRYIVKNAAASGTITVSRAGTDTIDGATTVSLTAQRAREFVSDGQNWQIIGAHL
jgi:hypothetical protein